MADDQEKSSSARWLAKVFTSEFIISAVIVIFTAGVLWNNIESSIAMAHDSAKDSAEKVERVEIAINKIRTDIEVIKATQLNESQKDMEQTRELAEQRKDIKQILRLLHEGGH